MEKSLPICLWWNLKFNVSVPDEKRSYGAHNGQTPALVLVFYVIKFSAPPCLNTVFLSQARKIKEGSRTIFHAFLALICPWRKYFCPLNNWICPWWKRWIRLWFLLSLKKSIIFIFSQEVSFPNYQEIIDKEITKNCIKISHLAE